jgi:hypothetical protein
MSSDHPTFSEVGEENIRSYLKRQQRKQHEEEYDEIRMPNVL